MPFAAKRVYLQIYLIPKFMQYIDYIVQHYSWQGVALAAAILVLFIVQLYYYIVIYGRVAGFRNSRRRKHLQQEPAVSACRRELQTQKQSARAILMPSRHWPKNM